MSRGGLLGKVDRPARLQGDAVVLREWSEADLDCMVELFDEPAVAYRTPLPSPFTRAEAQRRLGVLNRATSGCSR